MILWVWNRFRNLSRLHYGLIAVTILAPVVLTATVTYFAVECLLVRVVIDGAAFVVWSLFVVVVFALVVEKDRTEANQLVSEQTAPLAEQLERLREQQDDLIAGVRQQVEDLERRTRSTFEQLGTDLPPRSVSVRARGVSFAVEVSAAVGTVGGSRLSRLRRRFRRAMRRVWEVVYGKPNSAG